MKCDLVVFQRLDVGDFRVARGGMSSLQLGPPYAGRKLAGRVRRTVLRGVDISADVETNGDRHGRLLRRGEA